MCRFLNIFKNNLLLTLYTFPSVSPTFLSNPKSRISEGPQIRQLFGRWPLSSTWTVVRWDIFSSLEIKKNHWDPNPVNTRHPSCRDFFHTQFFVQNWKHCTLRYACGLNYFAHLDSSITQTISWIFSIISGVVASVAIATDLSGVLLIFESGYWYTDFL